jgi:acyl carrier protein
MTKIRDFVETYIKEEFQLSKETFSAGLDIFACYGADQLDMLEIMQAIEVEFEIEMPDLDYGTANDFIKAAENA